MNAAPTRGTIAYYGGWCIALGTAAAVAAQWVFVWASDRRDGVDGFWLLGAAAGCLVGAALARLTWRSRATHRVLRVGGRFLVVVGLAGAGVMWLLANAQRGSGDVLGGGVVQFLLAMLGLLVAGVGAGAWMAGSSGARLAPWRAPADGAPLA